MVIDLVPSVEMVRFVNSGTEACLSVLRLMRAFTKREKIIKFVGCYHGHADSFLVKAGSGVITLGLPDSPGETLRALGRHSVHWGCATAGGTMQGRLRGGITSDVADAGLSAVTSVVPNRGAPQTD